MATTVLEKRKFQRNLILVFVGMCIITIAILWNGFFAGRKAPSTGGVLETIGPKKVKINFEVLNSPLLKDFQGFEDIKPLEGTAPVGRENPFLSY